MDELERVLSSLGTPTPPRVPAFTPYVGEDDPGAYLTADGGWIRTRSAHQSDAGLAEQQPERVASGMSERELRPEDVPALFGRTPEAEPEQPVEPEAEQQAEQQAEPDSPDQQHNALTAQLLTAPKADREFLERAHGLRRDRRA
jgi:hypothetical protein